jgi:hypothetical protein
MNYHGNWVHKTFQVKGIHVSVLEVGEKLRLKGRNSRVQTNPRAVIRETEPRPH